MEEKASAVKYTTYPSQQLQLKFLFSILRLKWCIRSVDSGSPSYRYRPPLRFQPASPPSKLRPIETITPVLKNLRTGDLNSEWTESNKETKSCASSGTVPVIDCSSPQVRVGWLDQADQSIEHEMTAAVSMSESLRPVHARQRSLPVPMPSFEDYKKPLHQRNLVGLGGSLGKSSFKTASTASTISPASEAYNLVIDIHLHGVKEQNAGAQMTQSLIAYNNFLPSVEKSTIRKQGSLDHLPKGFIGDTFESGAYCELYRPLEEDLRGSTPACTSTTSFVDSFYDMSKTEFPTNNPLRSEPALNQSRTLYKSEPPVTSAAYHRKTPTSLSVRDSHVSTAHDRFNRYTVLNKYIFNNLLVIQTLLQWFSYSQFSSNCSFTETWKYSKPMRSSSICLSRNRPQSDLNSFDCAEFSPNMDIPQLMRLLLSPEPEIVVNATAYLQHLVYRNPSLKERTRQCGGIAALVQLLYSEHVQICQNSVGVLRNLTCGDNYEIKEELERVGGIRALAWLIENRQGYIRPHQNSVDSITLTDDLNNGDTAVNGFTSTLDSAAAVLCNLAAVNHLKRSVLLEAILPSLVHTVIRPAACRSMRQEGLARTFREPPFITVLFRNVAAVFRNVSSSEIAEVRELMRQCPSLMWSLITILQSAVKSQCSDTKSVEHCICCLRNLCYSLHTAIQPGEEDQQSESIPAPTNKSVPAARRFRLKTSSLKSNVSVNSTGSVLGLLCRTETLQMLVDLLQSSSNPCTLEAAAGTIQNLSAGDWQVNGSVRQTLRLLQCLPVLVELLNAPARRVATASANALRNLAIEDRCCQLLGRHGLVRILSALKNCVTALSSQYQQQKQQQQLSRQESFSSEWQTPTSARSGSLLRLSLSHSGQAQPAHTVYGARTVAAALLNLCCTLVQNRPENARRFVTLGGVEVAQEVSSVTAQMMGNQRIVNGDQGSIERVNQLVRQLLQALWNFVELRPIYKLAGWTESDFGILRRASRFSNMVKRRPKTNLAPVSLKPTVNMAKKDDLSRLDAHEDNIPEWSQQRPLLNQGIHQFGTLESDEVSTLDDFDNHIQMHDGQSMPNYSETDFLPEPNRQSDITWSEAQWPSSLKLRPVYVPTSDVTRYSVDENPRNKESQVDVSDPEFIIKILNNQYGPRMRPTFAIDDAYRNSFQPNTGAKWLRDERNPKSSNSWV
ncbi:hypothetical protein PHET_00863 [Paragonimus heterotremus]|uniref:Uncharacterized protein n=1 Tax=Paragonimus heterotremus TaxID=100268 RepID=A0A8J4ST73_9TREM|nr:hypothetical protein PHET_00863 [Paragonimus heterotremus]